MKKRMRMLSCVLIAGTLSTAVYGAFSDRLDVVNTVSVGDINISMMEYAKKGAGEVKYQAPTYVIPGQQISKIPRITNEALPCWIRARITYGGSDDRLENLGDDYILGISEDWVKRGEYFYYTRILKKKESVDLFQSICLPETWTEDHEMQEIKIDVQADAVQAANFTPDFSAMSPWGNQEIQQCIHEQNGTLTCQKGAEKLSVEFSGKAHQLIAVPDDFFVNLQTAMPGDVLHDSVTVSNTTDKKTEIFFWTGTEGRTEQQMQMLKEIEFEISEGEKKLYTGSLDTQTLETPQSLGEFDPGQEEQLNFMLKIPTDWDNSRALKKTDVTWTFATKEKNQETEQEDMQTENSADAKTGAAGRNNVKTGDISPLRLLWAALIGSGLAVLITGMIKGVHKHEKKD